MKIVFWFFYEVSLFTKVLLSLIFETSGQAALMKRDLDRDKLLARLYQESYDRMQAQIDQFYMSYAGQNGLTKQEAMKRVSDFDVTKFNDKAAKAVREGDFSPETTAWLKTYNLKMKASRLELLKAELTLEIQQLTAGVNEVFTRSRIEEYTKEYKRQAGILGMSSSGATKRMQAILEADFYGQKFSARVWGGLGLRATLQRDVFGSLNRIYTDMMGYQQERNRLAKKFGASKAHAQRLLKTEIARINADIQVAMLKANDFTHMIFVAEPGACDLCGPLDQKAIPIDEVEKGRNMFPMHPNCRCSAYGHIKMDYKKGGSTLEREAPNGVWGGDGKDETALAAHYPHMEEVTARYIDGSTHSPSITISSQVTKDGKIYVVDGHSVVSDHSNYEHQVASWLSSKTGKQVTILPRVNYPKNVSTPDYLVDGVPFDLKEITGTGKNVIDGNLRKAKKQAPNIILDITKTPLSSSEILGQLNQIYRVGRRGLATTIVKQGTEVIAVLAPKM